MHTLRLALALLVATAIHAQPFETHDVVVEATPSIRLAGTLTLPSGKGPHRAAILITGNGGHTRDQVISGSPMFRMLAEHLAANAIATLRLDDRGVGASTGPTVDESTSADRAADIRAAYQFLRRRPEIDPARIGLIGHSEGAMIAPMVARDEPAVRFLVLLAPPAIPGGDIRIGQMKRNLTKLGAEPGVPDAVAVQMRRIIDYAVSGRTSDDEWYALGHDFVAAHGVEKEKITHELIDNLISDFRNPQHRFFFGYDPAATLRVTKTPLLAAFGSADGQVTIGENLVPFAQALTAAANPDFEIAVFPDQDHFFFVHEGKRLERHKRGEMRLMPELLALIVQWIQRH